MKSCMGCKWARWERAANGRLHPSGDGRCMFKVKIPAIPASMVWVGISPRVSIGFINRKRELNDHCPCYDREPL